jgi:PrtD family type I secretion system ABC transporter
LPPPTRSARLAGSGPPPPHPVRLLRDGAFGLWFVLGLSVVLNLLLLTSPLYSLQIFDRVLPTRNVDTLLYLTVIAFFLVAALAAFDSFRQSVLAQVANWWMEHNRPLTFEAALRANREGTDLEADPFVDLQTVRNFLVGPAVLPLFDAPWVPLFVTAIWLLHPYLGMLALAAAVALFVLAIITDRVGRLPTQEAAARQMDLDRTTAQYLRGADPIAAMGMQGTLAARQRAAVAGQTRALTSSLSRSGIISGMSKSIRILVQMAVMGLGAFLVIDQELSPGGMIAASIICGRALAPVEGLIGTWRTLIVARTASRRLWNFLSTDQERAKGLILPEPQGDVVATGLRYIPKGLNRAVVNNVSLRLAPGTVTALLGPSGSGKTTFCRLLVGAIAPTAGIVRIDGSDLNDWRPDQLGPAIGYVSQGFELFAGTVRDNIARYRDDATDEEVTAAAQLAGCHDLIARLPKGYSSEVGEGGRLLSAGQRQRVSLARALFRSPKIIILDEANAFLDPEGEAALARTIVSLKERGCSVLIVTQRPALVGVVDKIGLMRDGKLEHYDDRDVILNQLKIIRGPVPAPDQPVLPGKGAVA